MTLSPEIRAALKQLIVFHEGCENFPYLDSKGNITIGIGYNLTARGLPDEWINKQYEEDVQYFYNNLMDDFPWFKDLDDPRKMVLIDMCFMGYKKLLTFKRMLVALSKQDYQQAAYEMLDSKWATEVKSRATMLANIMRMGSMKWAS